MIRLIIITLFFLISLFNYFPVPSKELWYLGILIPEYPWIFIFAMIPILIWSSKSKNLRISSLILGTITLLIFCSPIVRAYNVGSDLQKRLETTFKFSNADLSGFHQKRPFSFLQMFTGNGSLTIPFRTYNYAVNGGIPLTLNFSPSRIPGIRPCLVVVHGGSWTRGNNSEIAAVNNYYANAGYQVATINYRLAPAFHSPAEQEDVKSAFAWLRNHSSELKIDTNNFVLLGRSAGAQIVLTAAYTLHESGVKGVAAFYGPNDMLWSYDHPDNRSIMDSRQVQRDFLGGTPNEVKDRYIAESPLLNVNSKTIPTILVHGMIDAHVYYEQSLRLARKLDEVKVSNLLLSLPWATHGCEFNLNGPSGQLSIYAVERFFFAVTHKGPETVPRGIE